MKKKDLSIILSRFSTFQKQDLSLEQYQTACDLAADALWHVHMQGNIAGKVIADFGCGNGILGIGALLLGAKKAIFVDIDKAALTLAKQNKLFVEKYYKVKLAASFRHMHIKQFKTKVDVVLQNPPFGVQRTHADKLFLTVAMRRAPLIYSFHKIESKRFLHTFAKDNGFKVRSILTMNFPLRKTQHFHRKKVYYVKVGFWKIVSCKVNVTY